MSKTNPQAILQIAPQLLEDPSKFIKTATTTNTGLVAVGTNLAITDTGVLSVEGVLVPENNLSELDPEKARKNLEVLSASDTTEVVTKASTALLETIESTATALSIDIRNVAQTAIASINNKSGSNITLTREDLGIPSDEQIAEQEKDDQHIRTENGSNQRILNRTLIKSIDDVRDYVASAVINAGAGVKQFATEAQLKLYTPTADDPKFAYAFDTHHSFEWSDAVWKDLGPSELEAAKKILNKPILTFVNPLKISNSGAITIPSFYALTTNNAVLYSGPYTFTPEQFGRAYALYYNTATNAIDVSNARAIEENGDIKLIGIARNGTFTSEYDVVYETENNVIPKLPNEILNGSLDSSNPLDTRYNESNPTSSDNAPIVTITDTAVNSLGVSQMQKLEAASGYVGAFGQAQLFRRKLRKFIAYFSFIAHDPTGTFNFGVQNPRVYVSKLNANGSSRVNIVDATFNTFTELSASTRIYYTSRLIDLDQTAYPNSYIERVLIGARVGLETANPIYVSGYWFSYTEDLKGYGGLITAKDTNFPDFGKVSSASVFEYLHTKTSVVQAVTESSKDKLNRLLRNPLCSVRVRLVGDSITWGSGASNNSTSDPRNHALSDPRNNIINKSWANQLRKYIATRYFELSPTVDLSDGRGGSLVQKTQKVSIRTALAQGYVKFTDKFYKKTINHTINPSPNEGSTFNDYLDFSSTANVGELSIDVHSDNLTLVWASLGTAENRKFEVYVDNVLYGTYDYGIATQFGRETLIEFPYGKHIIRVRSDDANKGNGTFRFEGFYHTKKCWIWNDGLIGTNTNQWLPETNTLYQAVENTDDIVFIQLGTNDRNSTSRAPFNVNRTTKNLRIIVNAIKARNISAILMAANAVDQDQSTYNFTQADIAKELSLLAKELEVSFVDNYKATVQSIIDNVVITSDKLHPNDLGHTLMYRNIVDTLEL